MDPTDSLQCGVSLTWRPKLMIVVIIVIALLLNCPLLIRKVSVDERVYLFRGQMILLIEAAIFTASWYVWTRLRYLLERISRAGRSGSFLYCTWFTRFAVAVMLFLAQMSFIIDYFIHAEDPLLLSLVCFVCLGIVIQFVFCYFCLGRVYQVIGWARHWCFAATSAQNDDFVLLTKFIGALLFSISISVYGLYGGLKVPTVKTVEVPIKGLATSMDRLSVAIISDIHLGPTVGRTKLAYIVHVVNYLRPGWCYSFIYVLFTLIFLTFYFGKW